MRRFFGFLLAVSVFFIPAVSAGACGASCVGEVSDDEPSARADIESMKEEIRGLRKDMDEIKRVLISILPVLVDAGDRGGQPQAGQAVGSGRRVEAPEPLRTAKVRIGKGPTLGDRGAKVAIVEFSDYQCPFCARFHSGAFVEIKREFVDAGKVLYVHKDFPLAFHANAMKAAMAFRCAAGQGKAWEMNDLLFENQKDLGDVEAIAEKANLDMSAFRECMKRKDLVDGVNADLEEGRGVGVSGTPTFVIGTVRGDEVVGELFVGARPYPAFREKLNRLLEGRKQ